MAESNARLLTDQELAELGPPEAVRIPLNLIDGNPHNPRRDLVEIEALAENIRTFGLLQPITVRKAGDRYELLGGHRRRAAFLWLRDMWPMDPVWKTIPAVIRTFDDDQSYLALISGQVHNLSWRPREEAAALERLVLAGRSVTQVGEVLNRTASWASKRLKVYSDSVLSGYVQSGKLAPSVAEELLRVLDPKVRKELAERAAAEGWGQDHTRGQVRTLRLDRQLREVAKRAHEMLELLSVVDLGELPFKDREDLLILGRRIMSLARPKAGPVIPSIETAMQKAGVRTQDPPKKGGRPRRAGYTPKR